MQDLLYVLDTEQRHTGVFGSWLDNLGLKPEVFPSKTAEELFGEEKARPHMHANERGLKGEHVEFDWTLGSNGSTYNYRITLSPLFDHNGKVRGLVGVGRDVTKKREVAKKLLQDISDRKLSEQKLLESNRRLQSFLEINQNINSGSEQDDLLKNILEKALAVISMTSGAMYLKKDEETITRVASIPAESADSHPDLIVFEINKQPLLAKVFRSGKFHFLPDTWEAGLTPAEKKITESLHLRSILYLPIRLKRHTIGVIILVSTDTPCHLDEEEIRYLQGFADHAASVINDSRNLEQLNAYAKDLERNIEERKRTEEKLRESREQLHHFNDLMKYVIQHNSSAVAIHDKDLNYIYVSQRYLDDYNVKQEDIIGKHHYEVFPDIPQKWRDVHQRALKGEVLRNDEDLFKRADGTVEWTRWECRPWYDKDGGIGGIIIYSEVITDRKRDLEELNKLSTAVKQNTASVVITDTNGKIEYVNPKFTQITGYQPYEVLGENPRILKSGLQSQEFYKELWDTISSGKIWTGEMQNRKKNGKLFWELAHISPILNKKGVIVNYLAVKDDISGRKDIESQLMESEKRFKYIFSNLPDISVQGYDRNLKVIYWNKASQELYGYTREEVLGKKLTDLIIPENLKDEVVSQVKNWINHGVPIPSSELMLKRKDGSPAYVYCNHVLIENLNGEPELYSIDIDLAELKQTEHQLMLSEERYRSIIQASNTGAWEYNTESRRFWCSPEFYNMLGYDPEGKPGRLELSLDDWIDLLHPKDRGHAIRLLMDFISGGMAGTYENNFRMVHREGHAVWISSRGQKLHNPNSAHSNIILGVNIDISGIREAETRIRESELYHRSLLQTIPDVVLVLDKGGELLDCKTSSSNEFFLAPTSIGRNFSELVPELNGELMDAIQTCRRKNEVARLEFHLERKQGKRYYSANMVAFGKDRVIVTVRDVTDYQNNLERITSLLAVEEKQNESLRNFTHIVSHNLRIHTANMLGILMVFEMEDPETYRNQFVRMLKNSSEKLEETIGHLNEVLDIKLNKERKPETLNAHDAVNIAVSSLRLMAEKSGVQIFNEVPRDISVDAVPSYLDSIIMSLLSNAVQFHSPERDSRVRITAERNSKYTMIGFEDNGIGIDLKRHGDKIFKMYKKFHNGSDSLGLGLFVTKSQVEAMGGHVEVESEPDKGSTFRVFLPNEEKHGSLSD